jgi:hypothetical protein
MPDDVWKSIVNRRLKGMSPAHNHWSLAKGKAKNISSDDMTQAFNLKWGKALDELHRYANNVKDYMKQVDGPPTQEQKTKVAQLLERVEGIEKTYKDRCKQRKKLDGNTDWDGLNNGIVAAHAKYVKDPKGIIN